MTVPLTDWHSVYRVDPATEIGSATDPLISPTVEGQGENNSPGAAPGVSVANGEKSTSKERQKQQKIQESKDFLSCFNYIFDNTTSTKLEKELDFKTLLKRKDANLKNNDVQKAFVKMLKDIAKYEEFLKLFIERLAAYNERIATKNLPEADAKKENEKIQPQPIINEDQNTMRELDAPLHCAVRQLNKGFLEWLLKQPETEVNLRNKQKETALAILCQKYDCVSKWKARLEEIEKELKNANDTKKKELDDEKIELVALEKQLNELHLELIMMLLDNKADFNIYMNEGALPFDFLRKCYTEADLDEIIKKASVTSNVAITEKPPKQSNVIAEGKNDTKKRIVKFYKEIEDMDVSVTVELLEIFIWFQDLEKFELYWKDFKVTGDNIKKVITQLLHAAVELNDRTYVDHIVKKASDEIFKLEENKATDTQDTRSNTPEGHHICWCCFKCCQKRNYPDSQTQSKDMELGAITSNSPDEAYFISERTSTNAVASLHTQEKNETENSQVTCAGTSKRISTNAEGSYSENPSATEGAEPQTQSETSKLPVTDLHMESGTSKLEGIVPQKQSGTIESQDNPPVSQDTRVDVWEQPSQQAQRQNSKDLVKAEENKMVHHNELKGLLNMVCLNGNIDLLTMFLEKMNDRLLLNESPLLINTLNEAYTMKQKKKDFLLVECIKLLINNHSKVDMYRVDRNGNTALHLALSYGYDTIALLMLKKVHGLMGFRNRLKLTPIEYGTTEFWNSYLDSCISTNNDESELRFDVGFLKPRVTDESRDTWKCCPPQRSTRFVNDMTVLRLISHSKNRKEYLMHPVIIAFITMKWKRLRHWHILNLLLTTFTMGMFISFRLMSCTSEGRIYGIMAFIGVFLIFSREYTQWFLLRRIPVTLEHVFSIINLTFIPVFLACEYNREGWCEYVPVGSSLLVISFSIQATFLLGAIWNNLFISFYMLKTVSSSFFYSFLSFSPVIVAFAYSFYQIYNEPSCISICNGTESSSSAKNFNNFPSFLIASIKTLVMTTGEFDAANIDFNGTKWMLFVAFLFIAPMIILNLINGLAVSDIADIRKESEFISVCKKVKLLKLYERAIVGMLLPSPFFENYESIIYIMMNKKNILKVNRKKKANSSRKAIPGCAWLSISLDQSYVDKAKTIARRQYKNNLGCGTNELADTERTDRPALVNNIAMNQHKTPTLSKSTTGPSVPDSRDKQIEKLHEEVRNIVAMLTDIQQQLSGVHSSKAESTAGMTEDHSRVQ